MAISGTQYTLTATATKLTTILGLSSQIWCVNIDILGKSTNTGHVFVGGSTVTNVPANAWVDIAPGAGWSSGPENRGLVSTDSLYVVGTAADIAFIAYVV